MEEGGSRRVGVLPVPDELAVEILSRLPAKSLCLCRCVSRAWRALISDPDHRGRFAQTLSGLFFSRHPSGGGRPRGFVGLPTSPPPGVDAALSFLPPTCGAMDLLDSCNGLLLLRCEDTRERPSPPPFYVVCNPATAEWVALPRPRHTRGLYGGSPDTCAAALGFDPTVSAKFHVFQLVQESYFHEGSFFVVAVEIFSSETGRWVFKENNDRWVLWDIRFSGQMTYFSGFLHFCNVMNAVVSVDTEGQAWRISHVPHYLRYVNKSPINMRHDASSGHSSTISHSQGRLIYVYNNVRQDHDLSIYVLEDQDSEEWTWILKQTIDKQSLFGALVVVGWDYCIAAFHPNADLVFFYDWKQKTLMAYDMKHKDVHVICTLGEVVKMELGLRCNVHRPFLPYVPFYARALTSPSVN